MACSPKFQRRIESYLAGEISGPAWEELRRHLRGCASCRDTYDRLALAERLLHGGPAALQRPSGPELERIERAVMAQVEAPDRVPARESGWRWLAAPLRWAPAAALAVVVAIVVPIALWQGSEEPRVPSLGPASPEEFQPRGRPTEPERASTFRAFCVIPGAVLPLDPGPTSGTPPRCGRAMQLRFTVTNSGGFRHVFLAGLDEGHSLKWYFPRPPARESVLAPPSGVVDAPLDRVIRVGVNHPVGLVRIFALFSDQPVRVAEVEAAARGMAERRLPIATAGELLVGRADVRQRSLLLRVTP